MMLSVGVGGRPRSGALEVFGSASRSSSLFISPKSPAALWPLDRIFGSASGPSNPPRRRRRSCSGFTLIELMMVVIIVGVLAALATYGVSRYMLHAKTAEATRAVAGMELGSRNKFTVDTETSPGVLVHVFCPPAAAPLPATVPGSQKVTVTSAAWAVDPWKCLRFEIDDPHYYQYDYASSGTGSSASYDAYANGNLNGNAILSHFIVSGYGTANGEAVRSSFTVVNEDE